MSETPKKQLTAITSRNAISHTIAYLSDLAPNENGNYIRVTNTLGQNLAALDTAVANIPEQVDYSLTISAPQTPDTSYAAQYEFKQCGSTIATINIPKDMVVSAGVVVDITFDSETNKLKEGDTDVTEAIKGQTTPTASDAGKYIKLTIANKTNSTLYIKVSDLVDIYTTQQNATQVQLAISAGNEISATIVAGSIGTTELSAEVNASLAKADTALQASDVVSTYDAESTAPVNGVAVAAAIAAIPSVDISGKADKDTDAVEGNLAMFDANGNPVDAGKAASDFAEADHTHAQLKNGTSTLDMGVNSATISVPGPDVVNYVLDITGGTVSGNKPSYIGGNFSFDVPTGQVQIPVTLDSDPTDPSITWYKGQVTIDGLTYKVNPYLGRLWIYQGTEQGSQPQLWGLEYMGITGYGEGETPALGPNPPDCIGGGGVKATFTGSVNSITKTTTNPNVTKTLATTDDINALDAEVTSSDGTNVEVKVTEVNGKVTAVNITKDETYKKPAGGIPETDLASLSYFKLIDDVDGREYIIRMHAGRLEVLADEPYTPTGYPLGISMKQVSDGNGAGAASPRDFVTYTWKINQPNEYGEPGSIEKTEGSPNLRANVDEGNICLTAMNEDFIDLGWRIIYPSDFSSGPELECDEGAPISAGMFELSWVDPEKAGPFEGTSSAPAPKGKIQKRK